MVRKKKRHIGEREIGANMSVFLLSQAQLGLNDIKWYSLPLRDSAGGAPQKLSIGIGLTSISSHINQYSLKSLWQILDSHYYLIRLLKPKNV